MLKELKEKREEEERLKREEELKEKREEEERLKREEEERVRKLKEKEEEEERVRKLKEKEEQERIRRFKEEKEEYLKNRLKTVGSKKPYGRNFRRDAPPKARLSGEARSIPDGGAGGGANAVADGRSKPPRRANPEAQMSRDGRSDLEERAAAATDGGSDSKPLFLDGSKKKKKANWKWKKASKEREGEMTKTPLGLNGSTAPMTEKESEVPKVTADVDGSGAIINVSGGERCRPVKVVGSEPRPIAEVNKGVSDLKMGRGNPDPNRRGMGRGYGGRSWGGGRGSFGRGRGEGGMMWVKKTTEA